MACDKEKEKMRDADLVSAQNMRGLSWNGISATSVSDGIFYHNVSDNTNIGCKTLGLVLSFCITLYRIMSFPIKILNTPAGISIRIHFISICVFRLDYITNCVKI